jgi:hypothetical protein
VFQFVLNNSGAMLKQTNRIYLKNPRNIEGVFASQRDTNNDNTGRRFSEFLAIISLAFIITGFIMIILKYTVKAFEILPWWSIFLFFAIWCFLLMWSFIFRSNGLISLALAAIFAYLAQFWVPLGLRIDEKFPTCFPRPLSWLLIIAGPLPCTFVVVLILYFKNKKNIMIDIQKNTDIYAL